METLLSVGIDVGTTTTQMVVSRLHLINAAPAFAVARMEIRQRQILYCSQIYETPLCGPDLIDTVSLHKLISREYAQAGICPQDVQTGAVIITGETAGKENAEQVLHGLSDLAGRFVVAAAGPALESVLAAKGAGADELAREKGRYVLHMDIGGGTSNLALFDREGKLVDTGCLHVGGRLVRFASDGSVCTYSPILHQADTEKPEKLAAKLARILEESAGLSPISQDFSRFITDKTVRLPQEPVMLSFSGGVADLICREEPDWLRYRDLGVLLGRAIRCSKLCRGEYRLGRETIRATVIGAGSHSTELSGSTVWISHGEFPMHNLPVISVDTERTEEIFHKIHLYPNQTVALALTGIKKADFQTVSAVAEKIVSIVHRLVLPLVVTMEIDMAKALGQSLQLLLGAERPLVCLDGIHAPEGSYLDIGAPVADGMTVPVIIKTLAFQ